LTPGTVEVPENSAQSNGPRPHGRTRVLVVSAHLRRDRSKRRSGDALQPMAGLQLASQLDPARYELDLHHEDWHGPIDTTSCARYDLVFLTGLQADFDRMRQLSYHFKRRGAAVVAGGNFCTLFPEFAAHFFDAVCAGGIECIHEVVADFERGALEAIYRSPQTRTATHRVDHSILHRAGIRLPVHLLESSRGCNFRCKFCVIPAEGARHAPYDLKVVEQNIDNAIGTSPWYSLRRLYPLIWFLDNNFADSRAHLLDMCRLLSRHSRVRAWGALVTQNILSDRSLVRHLAQHKCRALFVGVESLDTVFLRKHNKKQNLGGSGNVVDDILFAESLSICVTYPYLFDPRIATTQQMRRQIRALVEARSLPVPAFFSILIPLVGTEDFWDCARRRELRPKLRLRDLDGETICYANTVDTEARLTEFLRMLSSRPALLMSRWQIFWSTLCRIRNSGSVNPLHWYLIGAGNFRIFSIARRYQNAARRTYLGGRDALDPQYREFPPDVTEEDRKRYFEPTMITDAAGGLADWLQLHMPVAARLTSSGGVGVAVPLESGPLSRRIRLMSSDAESSSFDNRSES
jgi:radical SAM superfamily enzyme YgiQ (UPF0313 family)